MAPSAAKFPAKITLALAFSPQRGMVDCYPPGHTVFTAVTQGWLKVQGGLKRFAALRREEAGQRLLIGFLISGLKIAVLAALV
ncbi:MAG: hypothetical protein C4K60_12095 [Ideonella sp. MAG2]|nr:MAG: hypothetical protein C4K60_12095 [Ideonella sp. MAG2]